MGVRCYPDVASLPEAPDLAGIVVPYESIKDVLTECGKKGVKTGVIITGQFAEIGTPDRRATQAWLKEFTSTSGMRICGPNCLGIANVTVGVKGLSAMPLGGTLDDVRIYSQTLTSSDIAGLYALGVP